jgi:hypothetical protein
VQGDRGFGLGGGDSVLASATGAEFTTAGNSVADSPSLQTGVKVGRAV